MKKEPLLKLADNMFGRLKPDIIKRINAFLENSTADNWDDISGIIIDRNSRMKTIWNAMVDIDPSFPHEGRNTDIKEKIIREWTRVPTAEEVISAINNCVLRKELKNHLN